MIVKERLVGRWAITSDERRIIVNINFQEDYWRPWENLNQKNEDLVIKIEHVERVDIDVLFKIFAYYLIRVLLVRSWMKKGFTIDTEEDIYGKLKLNRI